MPLIDTHAHLCDPVFDIDRQQVIERAGKKGVSAIIAVSETLNDARRNLALAKQFPLLKPAAGLYPGNASLEAAETMIAFIRTHHDHLIAIGEVGLDFWLASEEEEREVQREVLRLFIALSRELDLPLNIHSRSAGRHVIAMLVQHQTIRVQLHAFDGKWGTAMAGVEAGFFFSIPPSLSRSRQKQKLVKNLPLANILLETDAPVLGRNAGERNEPCNIVHVVETIAAIRGIEPQEIAEAAYANTRRLYGPL